MTSDAVASPSKPSQTKLNTPPPVPAAAGTEGSGAAAGGGAAGGAAAVTTPCNFSVPGLAPLLRHCRAASTGPAAPALQVSRALHDVPGSSTRSAVQSPPSTQLPAPGPVTAATPSVTAALPWLRNENSRTVTAWEGAEPKSITAPLLEPEEIGRAHV